MMIRNPMPKITRKADPEKRKEFALALQRYRLDRKMSQEQLAQLIGTSVFSISRWERGRHYPPRTTLKLLQMLGVL
jgi:DNA-binding transcriptional regulator YiaG